MQPAKSVKTSRRTVTYPAFIDLGDGSPAVQCTLCDASQEGAQLAVADPNSVPDEFILALSSDGAARRRCRVTWRTEDQVGVEFLEGYQERPCAAPMRHAGRSARAPRVRPLRRLQAVGDRVDIDTLTPR